MAKPENGDCLCVCLCFIAVACVCPNSGKVRIKNKKEIVLSNEVAVLIKALVVLVNLFPINKNIMFQLTGHCNPAKHCILASLFLRKKPQKCQIDESECWNYSIMLKLKRQLKE